MAKNPSEFTVNERISHFVYGQGTISQIDDRLTTIDFDTNGTRKFVTSMVQLEHCDVPAPEPPPKKARAKKPTAKSKK